MTEGEGIPAAVWIIWLLCIVWVVAAIVHHVKRGTIGLFFRRLGMALLVVGIGSVGVGLLEYLIDGKIDAKGLGGFAFAGVLYFMYGSGWAFDKLNQIQVEQPPRPLIPPLALGLAAVAFVLILLGTQFLPAYRFWFYLAAMGLAVAGIKLYSESYARRLKLRREGDQMLMKDRSPWGKP
jgi:hypothetical protein